MPSLLAMVIALVGSPLSAAAQPSPSTDPSSTIATVVLRSTRGISDAVAEAVDATLIHELEATAGLEDPAVSPIELEEIQLTAGCRATTRECLQLIAATIRADSVVVRELYLGEDGAAHLLLAYYDAESRGREAPIVERTFDPRSAPAGARAVGPAIRALFHIPARVAAGRPAPESPGVGAHTWVTLTAAIVLLAGGTVLGLSAAAAHEDYLATPVDTAGDADRAADQLEIAQDRALGANVLLAVGGAAAITAGVMLVLDLDLFGGEQQATVAPVSGGAVVALRGELGGP